MRYFNELENHHLCVGALNNEHLPVSIPQNWSYKDLQPCSNFCMFAEHLNSDPQVYAESSLTHFAI